MSQPRSWWHALRGQRPPQPDDADAEAEQARLRERREASARQLEAGGLPGEAVERLQNLARRRDDGRSLFTGTLTPNEFLLIRAAGGAVLGQVMGCSAYQTSEFTTSAVSGELKTLTRVQNEVRQRALGRLQQEAALLGASCVVGVRLARHERGGGEALVVRGLEFAATGTAISTPGGGSGTGEPPVLTALSGAEYFALRRGGYRPVGLAVGNCVYYRVAQPPAALVGALVTPNCERTDFTEAAYAARQNAMARMEAEARRLGAEGVVGVCVEATNWEGGETGAWTDRCFHFVATGTAVVSDRHPGLTLPILPVVRL